MKKTFQLAVEGKNPERLLEATKHEIRKYIKRERRRARQDGATRGVFRFRPWTRGGDHNGGEGRNVPENTASNGWDVEKSPICDTPPPRPSAWRCFR